MSEGQHLITLRQIRDHGPCEKGWAALLRGLGTRNLALKVTIADVAMVNAAERGIVLAVQDAIWCLRCIGDPRLRVRAILPAVRHASAYTQDPCVHGCIADIERWLAGNDSVDLEAARKAARAAALTAAATIRPAEAEASAARAAEAPARAAWAAETAARAARAARAALATEAAARVALAAAEAAALAAAEASAAAARAAEAPARGADPGKAELTEYQAQLDDLVALFGLHAAPRVAMPPEEPRQPVQDSLL